MPGKNIKLLKGKPMISYAIEAAKSSRYIDRVIVSTDDEEIANISREFGADTPFIRPQELAGDDVPMPPVLQHAVQYMEDKEGFRVDAVVLIQPASPLVTTEDIDNAIARYIETEMNSCVAMCKISERPEWMYILKDKKAEPYISVNERSKLTQVLPDMYRINGAVYVVNRDTLINDNKIIDDKSLTAIVMPQERSVDIDELYEFIFAEALLNRKK